MKRGLPVIFAVVALDGAGMGLVMPILPELLRQVGHTADIAGHYGLLLSAYALMQFLFSPVLGALSDRYGRRIVLLVSLVGAAFDYALMAWAPWLWLLYLSRMLAGVTGANMAVAGAYIADVTTPEERAKEFGRMSAAFGLGFVAGPLIGGWLGDWWVRAPFILAATLNGANFLVAFFLLPESRKGSGVFDLKALNPFGALFSAFSLRRLAPLLIVYGLIGVIAQVGAAVWVIYGQDRYGWSAFIAGLSLAAFGLAHAAAQAFLPGPLVARFGERRTLFLAMVTDASATLVVALARHSWLVWAMTPVFCVGGLANPALQGLMTREVSEDEQGQLQGNLAALMSLAGIVGPVTFAFVYGETRHMMPGFVWIAASSLYLLCIPPLIVHSRRTRAANAPQ